jgi:hypothetical protein
MSSTLQHMRASTVGDQVVTVATSSTVLVPRDEARISLIIQAPLTNRFSLSWGADAVLDQGITLYPGAAPLILYLASHGSVVKGPIKAISAVAGQAVYWVGAHTDCQCLQE